MSDFHQRGLISTLPRLNVVPLEDIERRLETLAESTATALILPCTMDDLRRPAMAEILRQLTSARYLSRIVVSVNQATADDLPEIAELTKSDPRCIALWNDDPALQALLPEPRSGKGFNLWTALGFLFLRSECECILTHDTDIVNYSRELPALLALPLLEPDFGYHFVKGYYPRHSGQLFGRVTRLFVGPLLRALVRVEGHHPLLDFLDSFRYPLAGEFGGKLSELTQFPLSDGWGLEIDLLCQIHRSLTPETIAQIELGTNYEHKHQSLTPGDTNLTRLTSEISACLLHHLAREGARITPDFIEALQSAYLRSAKDTIRRYRHVALLNRFEFHETQETKLAETFVSVLQLESFSPPLTSWSELQRTRPDFCSAFLAQLMSRQG